MGKDNKNKPGKAVAISKSRVAERILAGMELKEGDLEHIRIEDDGSVRFELSVSANKITINGKEIGAGKGLDIELNEAILEFLGGLLSVGGFKDTHLFSIPLRLRNEVEFYRDIETDEEAREAIRWLVEFKKRRGI